MKTNYTSKVYEAACAAAWTIVEACEASIRERIKAGEVTDEGELSDAIDEEVDSALTYTSDQYALVWGLRDEEDAIEEGLPSPSNFGEALTGQAYCNLRAALHAIDFSDAFEAAEDSELEQSEGGE